MEAIRLAWDFLQKEILGMQWLNRLMGSIVEGIGLDPATRIGGSIQFFFYDVVKIMVLLGFLILMISVALNGFKSQTSIFAKKRTPPMGGPLFCVLCTLSIFSL